MHFYERTESGIEPRHFVPMSTREGLRPSRVTDARKAWKAGRIWYPSVTTVDNVLDKGALTTWKIKQHLEVAHGMDPRRFALDDFIEEVMRLTEIKMDKAPSDGTAMHKVLEDWIQGKDTPPDYDTICDNIGMALQRIPTDAEWEPEVPFTHPLGFGGTTDLVNRDKGGILGDYKSKATADKFKPGKMAYDNHRMQLAAYRVGHGLPKARCFNAFVCLETGEVDIHWHTEAELAHGWELFQHALAIWQLQNGWPDELREAA